MENNFIIARLDSIMDRIRQIDTLARDRKNNVHENMGRIQVHCNYAKEEIERIYDAINK